MAWIPASVGRGAFSLALLPFFLSFSSVLSAQEKEPTRTFRITNGVVDLQVGVREGSLASERLALLTYPGKGPAPEGVVLETDGDFALDVMWTGWHAPGKKYNADNPITFSAKDFRFIGSVEGGGPKGAKDLTLSFKARKGPFWLGITWRLEEGAFFARKRVVVRDDRTGRHFLRKISPVAAGLPAGFQVVKEGDFGQPVALDYGKFGAFFGLEYPGSRNILAGGEDAPRVSCSQWIGERVGKKGIASDWAVLGLTPDNRVKFWFFRYLDWVRVAPVRPYTLYNSWYDLRAPVMVKDESHVMNEKNTLRIIDLFEKNMIRKYGIHLDAFVLDDGWDVYKSDWVLRKEQFPDGLLPIAERLSSLGSSLGIWFGPIGGYSHRKWRIEWMKAHGYEVIGDQLCLAGRNYHALFKKRVVDFVKKDRVAYYKWDGIQFSCSEPDHGHPVGIYSRRAVLESVIDLCRAVRKANPDVYLNITSGTWLSPWWLKYSNQIWMQGGDYGFSDVPSWSKRDSAMTYRDIVLYEDFHKKKVWFPISNMMTHGIIKGNLQKLGGEAEPLDKFTNNALLYFARGVSMWELYVSPDILTDGEWRALGGSIRWAKDRFQILRNTEMIGGDPGKGEPYGYAHFRGSKGVIALRNPSMEAGKIRVKLATAQGLDAGAASLVVERVYPTRYILPRIYAAGASFEVPLDGYETAVYEVYPLDMVDRPLLAGVVFDVVRGKGDPYVLRLLDAGGEVRLLNPGKVESLVVEGKEIRPSALKVPASERIRPLRSSLVAAGSGGGPLELEVRYDLGEEAEDPVLAILLDPYQGPLRGKKGLNVLLDGKPVAFHREGKRGRWNWLTLSVPAGSHKVSVRCGVHAAGRARVRLYASVRPAGREMAFHMARPCTTERPMPPRPFPPGTLRKSFDLGEVEKVLDQEVAQGVQYAMPHQSVTDAMLDKCSREIRQMAPVCRLIRERNLIPGLSTHAPESIVYADETGLDVEAYIQPFNLMGFLMQVEVDWIARIIQGAKKPVMTVKSMAAGQLRPFQALTFSWNVLRPCDMITVGTSSTHEAHELCDMSLQILDRQAPTQELQRTRSKASLVR